MKRIDFLTEDQKLLMPVWAKKWIDIGLRTGVTDWDTFDKYMPICYAKAGLAYPKKVIRVQSPIIGALASAIAEAIYKKYVHGAAHDAVYVAVGGAVDDAVHGVIDDAVDGAVDVAVHGAVHDAVDVAVGGAIDGAIHDAIHDAVSGAFRDAVDDAFDVAIPGAVGDAVSDAVHGAIYGAVYGAVDGAIGGAIGGAVSGAIRGAVSDAIDVAVGVAVRGAIGGAVHGAVDVAVSDAVGDAVDDAVHGAFRDAAHDAFSDAAHDAVSDVVRDAVYVAVSGAVAIMKKLNINIEWHYWLGGQFWVGSWYWGSAYSDFFINACGLEVSKDIQERFEAYKKINESVNYIWPNKNFVIVCARPTHIFRNTQGRLHCDNDMAIKYPDGWGLWMLNGVKVTKEIVMTPAEKLDCNLVLTEKNTEIRKEIIRKIGMTRIIKTLGAKVVHTEKGRADELSRKFNKLYKNEYELLNFDCIDGRYRPYLQMINPSTGEYHIEGIPPSCHTVEEALAWQDGDKGIYEKPVVLT